MCKCGCNTCGTNEGPLLTEGKVKSLLSEGLQYHIDKKIPLFETVYRIGSNKHLSLIKEARKMYSRNIINLCEEDEHLIKTHLGEFALYEGESVPLDLPMLEESNMPSQEEVNKFFSDTQNEMHYLNSKPVAGQKKTFNNSEVEPWDEYDLSNFNSLVRKAKAKSLNEKEGVPHYTKDGKEWKGKLHKMPDGSLMSGDPHDKNGSGPNGESEKLYHKEDLVEAFKSSRVIKHGLDHAVARILDQPTTQRAIDSLVKDLRKKQKDVLGKDTGGGFSMDLDTIYSGTFSKEESEKLLKSLQEKLKGIDGKACWKGYKLAGTKKKGGKTVDNCVPMEEAEFKGKEVPLGKPKRGGPKAYYVYVKDGDKVKKVTFGSGGLRAKIKNKEARNAFAARHNCKDKKDRTTPGYWSCNLPRYAQALGLGANMNTFW